MPQKVKIAFFDLTGCEGCEFHLLSLNEILLDVFQDFEITNWRLLSEEQKRDFDIAFIEGAATTQEHIELLKQIRETSKIVVALGACAISGNIFAQLNPEQRKKLASKIYEQNYQLKAKFLEPVEKFIKIDEKIPGCPPDIEKFKALLAKFKKEKITSKIKDVPPPEYVAKIEGHGRLKINFRQKKAEFEVEESERLVEGLLLGKNYSQAPVINARICGICPIAHNLCSWKAIEAALNIQVSQETIILREIMLCAQIVKSHLLHLFFLVLPDFVGLRSSIELSQKYPAEFHLMLNIKRVSEQALRIVAGSTAFPTNTSLGGFSKPPLIEELLSLRDAIAEVVDEAQDLIELFASFSLTRSDLPRGQTSKVPAIKSKIGFLTTQPPKNKYPLYVSDVIPKIKEIIRTGSTAKLGMVNSQFVKVGALARLAGFNSNLNSKAQEAIKDYPFEFTNPYHNNLAQAIEILHFLEEMIKLINSLVGRDLTFTQKITPPQIPKETVEGEACLEAPRGVLIHRVKLDKEGKILDYNIIPPTQINLASLEAEAQQVLQEVRPPERSDLIREIEKLIRAFDPCITCAVH